MGRLWIQPIDLMAEIAVTGAEEVSKGSWISEELRNELREVVARKYGEGSTVRALASEYHRSYEFIHALLEEAGVDIRGRGGDRSGRPRTFWLGRDQQRAGDGDRDARPESRPALLDSLGRQVRAARLEGDMTQEELAHRFPGKLSGPDVSRIERANQSVSIRQLVDLFGVLQKPVAATIDQVVNECAGEHLRERDESDYGVWSLSVGQFVEIAHMMGMSPGALLRLTCGDLKSTSTPPTITHGDLE